MTGEGLAQTPVVDLAGKSMLAIVQAIPELAGSVNCPKAWT